MRMKLMDIIKKARQKNPSWTLNPQTLDSLTKHFPDSVKREDIRYQAIWSGEQWVFQGVNAGNAIAQYNNDL